MFEKFQTFREPSLIEAHREAVRFCRAMASDTAPAYWLTLLGKSGTGKTMLARIIARFFTLRMDTYDGLLDEHQSTALTGGTKLILRRGGLKAWGEVIGDMLRGDYSGIRDLKSDWFVGLDDIGAEYSRNRELSTSKLYEILCAREGKFTVLTANLDLQQINTMLDARIASRLLRHGSVVVDVTAPDFNLR